MILLSYDVETTGLDKQKDRIIEAGFALYSTGQQKVLESAGDLVKSEGVPITQEITDITGITQAAEDDAKAVLEMTRRHAAQSPDKSFEKMVERAQSPLVIIQSHQDRNNNSDAKKFKFRWNPTMKIWWKIVKEMDLQELANQVPFNWSRLDKSITLEQLDTDS